MVYESTPDGPRPFAGVPLDISVDFQSWPPKSTSDTQGRYSVSGLTAQKLKVRAEKSGYSQPCRSAITLTADATLDVYLVADSTLARNGVPDSMPRAQPTLSGIAFERTAQGVEPIAGVRVIGDFSGGLGWAPSATTITDAKGRYLLCGVESDLGLELIAQREGHTPVTVPVNLRTTTELDIQLPSP
jgi:hypothetical protein